MKKLMHQQYNGQPSDVLAYTQADIERDLYMKLPAGFTLPDRTIPEQLQNKTGRIMFSSWKGTYMDKNKQAEFGICI